MRTCASFSHDVRTTARDAAILGEGLVGDGQAGRLWEWPLFSFFLPVVRPLHCGSDAWAITNKERRKKSNAAALCVGFAPGACMHALAARAAPPILGGRPCRVHACFLRLPFHPPLRLGQCTVALLFPPKRARTWSCGMMSLYLSRCRMIRWLREACFCLRVCFLCLFLCGFIPRSRIRTDSVLCACVCQSNAVSNG